jgi:hypothetical protein
MHRTFVVLSLSIHLLTTICHSIPKDSVASTIQQHLATIDVRLRNLSLLSEDVQYSALDNPIRDTVAALVFDTEKYFGSELALRHYSIDRTLSGSDALEAARKSARAIELADTMKSFQTSEQHRHASNLPCYVKVHQDHVDVGTLVHFDIPWERDQVRFLFSLCHLTGEQTNPEYLIILRDLDRAETDVLFEHTRRLHAERDSRWKEEEAREKRAERRSYRTEEEVREERGQFRNRESSRRRRSPRENIREIF